MRAYGIFDGGGVKGAALAGCLAAAQEQGITFVGYGGTSAGSMVALLAAVGYTGKELGQVLIDLDFRTLLEANGSKLERVQATAVKVAQGLRGGWWSRVRALLGAKSIAHALMPGLGLDEGKLLKQYLLARVKEKQPALAEHADITFEHLERVGCPPLKIVASDITRRKPAVFSREETEYGASVLDAVRASTSYPFAFRPVILNDRCLVDGGLASNLPAFLFDPEYRETRIPAFAFDLTSAPAALPDNYDLFRYGADLLDTAVEASDALLRRVLPGVFRVPIETPPGIDTLDFGIAPANRKRLFDAGYQATTTFLNDFAPLQRIKVAGHEMKRRLQTDYGSPQLFAPVLYGLAKQIERDTRAKNVRAHVMLPTGRPEPTRIVVYGYGMEGDADADLELAEGAGCSGQAWVRRTAVLADLEQAARTPEAWGMTKEQHAKVPDTRKSMLCVPIHREMQPGERPPAPIGTLAVDTPTPLDRTGWLAESGANVGANSRVVAIMMSWAYVLYHLLRR
jgi:NTE family protein